MVSISSYPESRNVVTPREDTVTMSYIPLPPQYFISIGRHRARAIRGCEHVDGIEHRVE